MRGCTITQNNYGIDLYDSSAGDLGTDASPGNNKIQGNTHVGISISGATPSQVNAVGNIWNQDVQGANSEGRYTVISTITSQVDFAFGNNYSMFDSWSLRR